MNNNNLPSPSLTTFLQGLVVHLIAGNILTLGFGAIIWAGLRMFFGSIHSLFHVDFWGCWGLSVIFYVAATLASSLHVNHLKEWYAEKESEESEDA
jgi:hypothetical protein